MEALYDGIDLENISVSMTINPSAWILLAMYVAMAKKRGLDLNRLSGTIQADILKEYMAQKEYCFPIGPSVRICRDCITYCAENMRRYNPINISGYHISEAAPRRRRKRRSRSRQRHRLRRGVLKTGMGVDTFAPRLAFYFVSQADFSRGSRNSARYGGGAKIMKTRFGEELRIACGCASTARRRRRR